MEAGLLQDFVANPEIIVPERMRLTAGAESQNTLCMLQRYDFHMCYAVSVHVRGCGLPARRLVLREECRLEEGSWSRVGNPACDLLQAACFAIGCRQPKHA